MEQTVGFIALFFMGIFYFILCGIVAIAGAGREISAGWAFLIALLLSPFVGLICVVLSERKTVVQFRSNLTREMNEQRAILEELKKSAGMK